MLELSTTHWSECKNPTKVNIYDRAIQPGKVLHRFICIECPGVSEDDFEVYHVPNGVKAEFVSKLVLFLIVAPNCDECLNTTESPIMCFHNYSHAIEIPNDEDVLSVNFKTFLYGPALS